MSATFSNTNIFVFYYEIFLHRSQNLTFFININVFNIDCNKIFLHRSSNITFPISGISSFQLLKIIYDHHFANLNILLFNDEIYLHWTCYFTFSIFSILLFQLWNFSTLPIFSNSNYFQFWNSSETTTFSNSNHFFLIQIFYLSIIRFFFINH